MELLWTSLFLALLLHSMQTLAQSNGDVRLVGGSHAVYKGRLEIFLNGKWGTFCGSDSTKFSRGAAEAACKQLGYLDQNGFGSVNQLGYPAADPGTPMHIGSANCDYSFGIGELHILRCDISEVMSPDCSQSTAIGVRCLDVSLWIPSQNYNGAVRTSNITKYTSSGVLEIYLNKAWGNVCGSAFNQLAADSACRQMGYTNAARYDTNSQNSQDTVWLDGVTCHSGTSCACLNRCFESPDFPAACSKGSYIYISCMFDVSIKDVATTGNIDVCSEPGKCTGPISGGGNESSISGEVGWIIGGVLFAIYIFAVLSYFLFLCNNDRKTKTQGKQEQRKSYGATTPSSSDRCSDNEHG